MKRSGKLPVCVLVFFGSVVTAQAVDPVPEPFPDPNGDQVVNVNDLLIVVRNWKKPGTFETGDLNGDHFVDGDDLSLWSRYDGTGLIEDPSHVQQVLQSEFSTGLKKVHINSDLPNGLDIVGMSDVEFHFHKRISGAKQLPNNTVFGNTHGLVNIVHSSNLKLFGLDVENTFTFNGASLVSQSSCALNVEGSTGIRIYDAKVKSSGKSTFLIGNHSNVSVYRSTIEGYYYGFVVGASDLTAYRSTLISDFGQPDNHPAIWVSAAYSASNGGPASKADMSVTFSNCDFDLRNGKAIVAGGSSDLGISARVTLNNPTITFPGEVENSNFGLVGYARTWNSITFNYSGGTVNTRTLGRASIDSQLIDFTTSTSATPVAVQGIAANFGLGRFVHYQNLNAGTITRPEDTFSTLPTGNTVSAGLDIRSFDPNDPLDEIYR